MINENEHLESLTNAVREPVSALSAVEVDTVHRAERLVKLLQTEIATRPSAALPLLCSGSPGLLLDQAKKEIADWAEQEGVLFIVDQGRAEEKDAHQFWMEMNFLRESWGGLKCHVIFFLLPLTYRTMMRDADHLADWIPLKLHILGISHDDGAKQSFQMPDRAFSREKMSFKTARQVLSALQEQLTQALHQGTDKSLLVRRYYLPMFEAAMTIYDLQRAQSLRRHISEADIKETEMPEWLFKNYVLDVQLRNLDDAEKSVKRLLQWAKENKDRQKKAQSCHAMGIIAEERRDFASAEKWYRKSLEISEKHGNEHGAAGTYHQLGRIAQERRDFDSAEKWYRESLEISEKHGNEHDAAVTYHQLGRIAQERRDFASAEKWYRKSLEIKEKHGNEHDAAVTYHQLGIIAHERRDFDAAEKWYRKSLEIEEKHGSEHGAASTYHQLGIIAEERRDFASAEKWYRKSLEIREKHGNEYLAAFTYGQLGILAGLQEHFKESGKWLIKAILLFAKWNDPTEAQKHTNNFMISYKQAAPETQAKLKAMWESAGLGELSV